MRERAGLGNLPGCVRMAQCCKISTLVTRHTRCRAAVVGKVAPTTGSSANTGSASGSRNRERECVRGAWRRWCAGVGPLLAAPCCCSLRRLRPRGPRGLPQTCSPASGVPPFGARSCGPGDSRLVPRWGQVHVGSFSAACRIRFICYADFPLLGHISRFRPGPYADFPLPVRKRFRFCAVDAVSSLDG